MTNAVIHQLITVNNAISPVDFTMLMEGNLPN
jgi:hypothetical protein